MKNAIEINGLSCGYLNRFMLRDLSFDVPEGEFLSVVGPNGAGKTTLFRAIAGLLPVKRGMIRINGQDAADFSCKERAKKLAVVNQSVEADRLTVEEYVLMGRLPHHSVWQLFETATDYGIAGECMRLTGIWDKKDKYMDRLSGGEQQLAAIARALAQQTGILLLDEPTSHLDLSHQIRILNLVRRLNRERGLTVLLVIHDLNLAGEFSSRLLMLDRGGMYRTGAPEEVVTERNIRAVYEAEVIVRRNPLSDKPCVFPVSGG